MEEPDRKKCLQIIKHWDTRHHAVFDGSATRRRPTLHALPATDTFFRYLSTTDLASLAQVYQPLSESYYSECMKAISCDTITLLRKHAITSPLTETQEQICIQAIVELARAGYPLCYYSNFSNNDNCSIFKNSEL